MHDISESDDGLTPLDIPSAAGGEKDFLAADDMESTGRLPRIDEASIPEMDLLQKDAQEMAVPDPAAEPEAASLESAESGAAEGATDWGFERSSVWEGGQEASSAVASDNDDTSVDLFGGQVGAIPATDEQDGAADEAERAAKAARGARIRKAFVVGFVLLVFLLGYGVGVAYYNGRFLSNTTINGLNVSGATHAQAQALLEEQTAAYSCNVSVANFNTVIPGGAIALDRDEESLVNQAFQRQSPFVWPIALFVRSNHTLETSISYDEAALSAMLDQAVDTHHEATLPTENAGIEYNYDSNVYELVGYTQGNAVDKSALKAAVGASLMSFSEQCTPAESEVLRPATVADIPLYARVAEWINRDQSADIDITVNGEPVLTADSSLIRQWTHVGEGPMVIVDQDAIREWADYAVADSVFYRDDWDNHYLDVDTFVADLSARLATGVVDDLEAPRYEERRREGVSRDKAYAYSGWNSELGRYIDVDLTAQFARLYSETGEVLWESAIVSGNTYLSRSTVTGDFQIYAKQTGTTLVGMDYDKDGKPDYESYVNYWMPFYGGYGLHDATWRYTFGGELFVYDGSHGCVNLPYDKAEELFELTFVGEKVHIYWEEVAPDTQE